MTGANNRIAEEMPKHLVRVYRPGTEVYLVGSGIPQHKAWISATISALSGFLARYVVVWWANEDRREAIVEACEIVPVEDVAENYMLISL